MTYTEIMNDYRARKNKERRHYRRAFWLSFAVTALIFGALMLWAIAASAGITCTTLYNTTYCTDDGSTRTITCYRIYNTTYCN